MPIYEYECSQCGKRFELLKPRSESKLDAECPDCKGNAPRIPSSYGFYAASAPDSPMVKKDGMQEKMWVSQRKIEDDKIKNPDPLKKWRDERCETLGYGPEKWTEWANEEKAKEQKKKDYGEGWKGREA